MSSWIFKCNPERYRLADRLADPNPELSWTVTRYRDEIAAGDTIYIWETGLHRGIRGVLRADSDPKDMAETESEQRYWAERDTEVRCRVIAKIVRRDINLHHSDLREIPGLENLSVFHGFQQGTNFRVDQNEAVILKGLVERIHT